jgi:hypothetical protein
MKLARLAAPATLALALLAAPLAVGAQPAGTLSLLGPEQARHAIRFVPRGTRETGPE